MFKLFVAKCRSFAVPESKTVRSIRIGFGCFGTAFILYKENQTYQNSRLPVPSEISTIRFGDNQEINVTDVINKCLKKIRESNSDVLVRIDTVNTSCLKGLFIPNVITIGLIPQALSKNPSLDQQMVEHVNRLDAMDKVMDQNPKKIKAGFRVASDLADFMLYRSIFKSSDWLSIPLHASAVVLLLPNPLCYSIGGVFICLSLLNRSREYQADLYAAQKLSHEQLRTVIRGLEFSQTCDKPFEKYLNMIDQPSYPARIQRLQKLIQ